MTLRTTVIGTFAALVTVLAAGATVAQTAGVDYVGYAWETGGIDVSDAGDQLAIATVITQIDPLFAVDLGTDEATLYIEGLSSQGAVTDAGTGITTIHYGGGTIAIYAGPVRNHDWGVDPANATVPSTFVDGDLVLSGEFTSFTLTMNASGAGVLEGYLNATGGSAVAGPCSGCAYTFAGTFAGPTGAQIPAGYDLQVDGMLEVEAAVPSGQTSWSSLKQLYNTNP